MALFIRTIFQQEDGEGHQIIVNMYSESDGSIILMRFIDDKLEESFRDDGQSCQTLPSPPASRASRDALSNAIIKEIEKREIEKRPLETLTKVLEKITKELGNL